MAWPQNALENLSPPGDDPEAIWRDAIERGWQRSTDSLLALEAAFQDRSLPLSAMEPVRDLIADLVHALKVQASERNARIEHEYFRLRADGYSVEEALAEVGGRFGMSADSAEYVIRRNDPGKFSGGRRRRRSRKARGSTVDPKKRAEATR